MQTTETRAQRVKLGAKTISPGIAWGALTGSVIALLFPSAISIGSLAFQKLSAFPATKLGQSLDPWLKAIVAPNHLLLISLITALALVCIAYETLWQFLQRLYNWAIYEPTLLWAVG